LKDNAYDLCVIGCGPSGFAGAMRGFDLGKRVCVVERAQMGGAGVMWGALASKTMWELSKDYYVATRTGRGYRAAELHVDYTAVRNTVLQAIKEKQGQMRAQLSALAAGAPRAGEGSITLKRGQAEFTAPDRIRIVRRGTPTETIQADYFLLCTGSKPRTLPGITIDQAKVFDSDGILRVKAFPKRLMIVGAGIVGCEYATIFSNYGQTRVVLIDHQDRILPFEDIDVSDFVSRHLTANSVDIVHSARLKSVSQKGNQLDITLERDDGNQQLFRMDALLLSVGRVPVTSGLGLKRIGIAPDARGYLKTDDRCCVKDRIYAAGDVTNHPALVNLAEAEARLAVEAMFGLPVAPLRYDNMSTVMFFYPPVAAVGLNEKQCRENGIAYRVGYYANSLVPRAIAMRSLDGFVKIIVSDDGQDKILGMRSAGPHASSTIVAVATLMDHNTGIKEALKSMHPHPAISEGIQECLRLLMGNSVYKAEVFPDLIKIRHWRP
jgi:dihydrolipoamide dehydrogenase